MTTLAATRFPTITPDALAALQARLGPSVRRPEPSIDVATRDAIRHWAHGIGDRNPYWEVVTGPLTVTLVVAFVQG